MPVKRIEEIASAPVTFLYPNLVKVHSSVRTLLGTFRTTTKRIKHVVVGAEKQVIFSQKDTSFSSFSLSKARSSGRIPFILHGTIAIW
jgi:hypothetical protein